SIRYEAWIFFFAMVAILAFPLIRPTVGAADDFGKRMRSLLALGVTGALWPGIMMFYCWRLFGDPLHLVSLNRLRLQVELAIKTSPLSYQLGLTPAALAIGL